MNDTTAQFGMHLGQTAVAVGQDYVQKNFGGMIPVTMLKHHFNVSNSYVMHKLQLIIFPWLVTDRQPPRDDINSPDLYIPLMALVAYILVAALQTGLQERFHPQILGASATRALLVCGCYLLNLQDTGHVVDLIAYGGPTIYALACLYAFAANPLLILRSLRSVVLPDSPANVGTVNPASRKRRITLFLEAVLQVAYMGILVRV
ncbi:YIF1-domain-containing protein [Suillus lakei]|nr:YIF1-domain-containing protein [Suillus lakei]